MYEGQQRGGDPYQVEWITLNGAVMTCFLIDSGSVTTSSEGLTAGTHKFVPDGDTLNIYDSSGVLVESLPIKDCIFYCSAKGYTKITRTNKISDFIKEDYLDMSAKLVDHLRATKAIP